MDCIYHNTPANAYLPQRSIHCHHYLCFFATELTLNLRVLRVYVFSKANGNGSGYEKPLILLIFKYGFPESNLEYIKALPNINLVIAPTNPKVEWNQLEPFDA
jgi:hypothetical protein